jgi:hypothetical protein
VYWRNQGTYREIPDLLTLRKRTRFAAHGSEHQRTAARGDAPTKHHAQPNVLARDRPRARHPHDGPDPRLVPSLDGEAESGDRRMAAGLSVQPRALHSTGCDVAT